MKDKRYQLKSELKPTVNNDNDNQCKTEGDWSNKNNDRKNNTITLTTNTITTKKQQHHTKTLRPYTPKMLQNPIVKSKILPMKIKT